MSKKYDKTRHVTQEDMDDPDIRWTFLKAFKERTVDAGLITRNKSIKTNCITLRARRGPYREFIDDYLTIAIVNPHDNKEQLKCNIHRLAAFLFIGELKDKLQALHNCDVKMCCNPEHIYIGTSKNNADDSNNRRTDKKLNGKLTRYDWESINYWKDIDEHTGFELAEHFDVHINTIFYGGQNFTTDGSEVIVEIFIPKMIPMAKKVSRIYESIGIGNELITLKKMCKVLRVMFQAKMDIVCEGFGITRCSGYNKMILARAKPCRKNFKYGEARLTRWAKQHIDISVPI